MFFRANLRFKVTGLIALAFLVLAAPFALAGKRGGDHDTPAVSDDDFPIGEDLGAEEVLTEHHMEQALQDPEKAMASIKNSPYGDDFNKAFKECTLMMFPPISPMSGAPPDKEYFRIDRKEVAAHRKCMADKGFKDQDYEMDSTSGRNDADLDRNYKKIEDSYKMLDDAMKHLEEQRKLIAEKGAGALTQEDMDKFSVPVTRESPSKVYKFERDHRDDDHDEDKNRRKKKE